MMYVTFAVALLFAVTRVSDAGNCFTLEIEDYVNRTQSFPADRVITRPAAIGEQTLLMKQGDFIDVNFCLTAPATVQLTELRYSNDGAGDRIVFRIDNKRLGTFVTAGHSMWGYLWNVFVSSGKIGSAVRLSRGRHVLRLLVRQSDEFGVEPDNVRFDLEDINCGLINQAIFSCRGTGIPGLDDVLDNVPV